MYQNENISENINTEYVDNQPKAFSKAYISETEKLYQELNLQNSLEFSIFQKAIEGQRKMPSQKNQNLLCIIDFSKPSTEKRMFIIDVEKKKLLYHILVAHGKNSGENYATQFSNEAQSLCSSLGFYVTAETYNGKHGYSLKLEGMEKGFNDQARNRAIVIHGADYVNEEFVKVHGRLGRSWGCPAISNSVSKEVIDLLAKGACIFVYANNSEYLQKSSW